MDGDISQRDSACLPCEALSSNLNAAKKKNLQLKRGGGGRKEESKMSLSRQC